MLRWKVRCLKRTLLAFKYLKVGAVPVMVGLLWRQREIPVPCVKESNLCIPWEMQANDFLNSYTHLIRRAFALRSKQGLLFPISNSEVRLLQDHGLVTMRLANGGVTTLERKTWRKSALYWVCNVTSKEERGAGSSS